jgi:DNA-binding response OmpR family regulator
MDLKVLFIEDDDKLRENLIAFFNETVIAEYTIIAESTGVFREGLEKIIKNDYDLVILDLYNDKDVKDEEAGIKVLNDIRKNAFVPVIFYTGHPHKVADLSSEIVGVVSKGEGIEKLILEIDRIIKSKLALIKTQVYKHLKESLRKYFWETVDSNKKAFPQGKNDFSLGYLLLRRFSDSLSKENIKSLLGDDKIKIDKAHPMEFYIYPTNEKEFQEGEILLKDGIYYAILTPSCDFILDGKRPRKVGMVLLAKAKLLTETEEYKKYISNKDKYKQNLFELVESRKSDRYFFLPKTPFIENLVLDFQIKTMVDYEELKSFTRVAKLDNPFAQSMIASFVRYYNRIGFPDIDAEYVISNI